MTINKISLYPTFFAVLINLSAILNSFLNYCWEMLRGSGRMKKSCILQNFLAEVSHFVHFNV